MFDRSNKYCENQTVPRKAVPSSKSLRLFMLEYSEIDQALSMRHGVRMRHGVDCYSTR